MTDLRGPFEHIVIIMFENQYREYVLANDYFKSLADQGVDVGTSFGVMHPSQTNYIASIAGELCNVAGDERPPVLAQRTIVDLIEEAGLTWKAYMDGYLPSSQPWTSTLKPADAFPYVVKHNPFSSFAGTLNNKDRWDRVVGEADFWTDLVAGTLPHYCWFTPDIWNDGHYLRGAQYEWVPGEPPDRAPALVDQAAEWLEWFFGTLRFPGPDNTLPPRTLVAVTFDEADFEAAWDTGKKYTYDGPNQIYTVLLGDDVPAAVETTEGYNHYSLLRTVEENFDLGSLEKNDADSNWFRFLWGDHFEWGQAEPTPLPATDVVAAAGSDAALHVVGAGPDGALWATTYSDQAWSPPSPLGHATSGGVAMTRTTDGLLVVFCDLDGSLVAIRSSDGSDWSPPVTVFSGGPVGSFALAACNRGADAMLCFDIDGQLLSVRCHGTEWGPIVDTGHRTSGAPALCALGHTLLLVFAAESNTDLQVVTYTTAAFNTISIQTETQFNGRYNDCIADHWSPSVAPVAHFAAVTTPTTSSELEPLLQPYRSSARVAMTELDGVVHLVYCSEDDASLSTARFSTAGLLTPRLPISYRASDGDTTSNGYGTMAEAGWTTAAPVAGAPKSSVVCAASTATSTFALLRTSDGAELEIIEGRYGPNR